MGDIQIPCDSGGTSGFLHWAGGRYSRATSPSFFLGSSMALTPAGSEGSLPSRLLVWVLHWAPLPLGLLEGWAGFSAGGCGQSMESMGRTRLLKSGLEVGGLFTPRPARIPPSSNISTFLALAVACCVVQISSRLSPSSGLRRHGAKKPAGLSRPLCSYHPAGRGLGRKGDP